MPPRPNQDVLASLSELLSTTDCILSYLGLYLCVYSSVNYVRMNEAFSLIVVVHLPPTSSLGAYMSSFGPRGAYISSFGVLMCDDVGPFGNLFIIVSLSLKRGHPKLNSRRFCLLEKNTMAT